MANEHKWIPIQVKDEDFEKESDLDSESTYIMVGDVDLTESNNNSNVPTRINSPNGHDSVDENGTVLAPTTTPDAFTIITPVQYGLYDGNTSNGNNEISKESEDSSDCVIVEEVLSTDEQLDPKILWITNLPKNTKANEIKQLLSLCGKVMCAKVVVNAKYPGSCCFGYVVMNSTVDANRVIEQLNDTEFNGQIIKIDKFGNETEEDQNNKNESDENNKNADENQKNCDKIEKNSDENQIDNNEKSKNDVEKKRASSVVRPQQKRRSRSLERRRSHHSSTKTSTKSRNHRSGVLTFDKIKEERERQRLRDRERASREDSRRRYEETLRIRELTRRQRDEADRLKREREQLRIVRDEIERKRSELMRFQIERFELPQPNIYDNGTSLRRDNENHPNNFRLERSRYDDLSSQRKYSGSPRYHKHNNRRRYESGSEFRGAQYRDIRSEGNRTDLRYSERERSPRYTSNVSGRFGRANNSIWNTNEHPNIPGPSNFRY